MPLLDDNEYGVWLDPEPKVLKNVSDEFANSKVYSNTIQHNLLAEYNIFYRGTSNKKISMIFEKFVGRNCFMFWLEKKHGKCEHGSLFFNIFYVKDEDVLDSDAPRFLVVGFREEIDGYWVILQTTPENFKKHFHGPRENFENTIYKFYHLGYIGSYVAEYKALQELSDYVGGNKVIDSIINPRLALRGAWAPFRDDLEQRVEESEFNRPNSSQFHSVKHLKYAVEKIQGPPGTGKSTTICEVLRRRIPANEIVIVVCTRNAAVAAIAGKVSVTVKGELLAFGSRLEPIAKRFTVEERYNGLSLVLLWKNMLSHWRGEFSDCKKQEEKMKPCRECKENWSKYEKKMKDYKNNDKKKENEEAPKAPVRKCKSCRIESTILWKLMYRYSLARALADEVSKTVCEQKPKLIKGLFQRAKVFVSSISSCERIRSEYNAHTGKALRVHTVIVDECGCVQESSTALLANLYPKNFLLVGDHKQLKPFSLFDEKTLRGTNHNRSLLERSIDASKHYHMLSEQYRMHPRISAYVSNAFYMNRLTTPASAQIARKNVQWKDALRWIDCKDEEESENGKSTMNKKQADLTIKKACEVMRKYRSAKGDVAILTFYAAQVRELKMRVAADAELAGRVEVFTVDKCQGTEFEHVLLSTVRCNPARRVGFLTDKARVNVACSRARSTLTVVGCRKTLARGGVVWQKLLSACSN